uniref:Uncharacterized protein n=1 Tax=Globodera rostochiensis TaxID=31243 RepID=A0A914HL76_GLORO
MKKSFQESVAPAADPWGASRRSSTPGDHQNWRRARRASRSGDNAFALHRGCFGEQGGTPTGKPYYRNDPEKYSLNIGCVWQSMNGQGNANVRWVANRGRRGMEIAYSLAYSNIFAFVSNHLFLYTLFGVLSLFSSVVALVMPIKRNVSAQTIDVERKMAKRVKAKRMFLQFTQNQMH